MSLARASGPQTLAALEGAYLHARAPADARIVLWQQTGDPAASLPEPLRERATTVPFQILLPAEESSLRPVASSVGDDDDRPQQQRTAPSLWTIPGTGLALADAIPWLATLDPAPLSPSLRMLAAIAKLTLHLRDRGDFAPAPQPGVAQFAPRWSDKTQWILAGIAELVPGCLRVLQSLPDAKVVEEETPA